MGKVAQSSELFQYFIQQQQEDFWGDRYSKTRLGWKKFWEAESERQRDLFCGVDRHARQEGKREDYRNGYDERDVVTRFGSIRLRIARSRARSFLLRAFRTFQRRTDEVALLIREAFLRGVSTRKVGRLVALLTEEVVSAQTVSKLTRDLDQAVKSFHRATLRDEWAYL